MWHHNMVPLQDSCRYVPQGTHAKGQLKRPPNKSITVQPTCDTPAALPYGQYHQALAWGVAPLQQ
jgi:hypothetical protein